MRCRNFANLCWCFSGSCGQRPNDSRIWFTSHLTCVRATVPRSEPVHWGLLGLAYSTAFQRTHSSWSWDDKSSCWAFAVGTTIDVATCRKLSYPSSQTDQLIRQTWTFHPTHRQTVCTLWAQKQQERRGQPRLSRKQTHSRTMAAIVRLTCAAVTSPWYNWSYLEAQETMGWRHSVRQKIRRVLVKRENGANLSHPCG